MIYELRVYQPVPGQMPKLLARFRDKVLPIWERHGIRAIGFWTTLVGESSNELTYMLPRGVACRSRDEVDGTRTILVGTRSATTASAMGPSLQASATRYSHQRPSRR
jgi:hypothetical protein